jgi:hypothetical protein
MRWHDFWCKLLKICENPYSEKPGTSPMVVLAAGGIGTSTDSARRPDHLRQRAGKWLAELELEHDRESHNTGTYVHSGAASISATITSGWSALSLWHSALLIPALHEPCVLDQWGCEWRTAIANLCQ